MLPVPPLSHRPPIRPCGFLVAAVWYLDIKNRERAKKKRKKAMFAMVVSLSCCVCSLLLLLGRMFL